MVKINRHISVLERTGLCKAVTSRLVWKPVVHLADGKQRSKPAIDFLSLPGFIVCFLFFKTDHLESHSIFLLHLLTKKTNFLTYLPSALQEPEEIHTHSVRDGGKTLQCLISATILITYLQVALPRILLPEFTTVRSITLGYRKQSLVHVMWKQLVWT